MYTFSFMVFEVLIPYQIFLTLEPTVGRFMQSAGLSLEFRRQNQRSVTPMEHPSNLSDMSPVEFRAEKWTCRKRGIMPGPRTLG